MHIRFIKRFHGWSLRLVAVLVVSLGLIASSIYSFLERERVVNNPAVVIPTEEVLVSVEEPDETPVKALCEDYTVQAGEPRSLQLPGGGDEVCIQKVGVDQNNAIAVPTNIHLVGWYTRSVKPGDAGISVLVGHVQGRYLPGVFSELSNVKSGEGIQLEKGDGSVLQYKVIDVASYPVAESLNKAFRKVDDAKSQISLITCGGEYDEVARTYSERVVVRAVLL